MSSLHKIIAAIVAHHSINSKRIVCQAALLAGASHANEQICKPTISYKRHGTLCKPNKSVWWCTLKKGDKLKFLYFTLLTCPAFNKLVEKFRFFILTNPVNPADNPPKKSSRTQDVFSARYNGNNPKVDSI